MKQTSTFAIKVGETNVVYQINDNDHALFVSLGATLATIQSFETTVATFLTTLNGDKKEDRKSTFEELMSHYTHKTLGALIKYFRKYVYDDELADRLEEVRKQRNFLVHGILRKYGWWMMSGEEYLEAINEITQISNYIQETERLLGQYVMNQGLIKMVMMNINMDTGKIDLIEPDSKTDSDE